MAIGITVRRARLSSNSAPLLLMVGAAALLGITACGSDSGDGNGFAPIPTRTTTSTASQTPVVDPGGAVSVRDFTLQPTYECLDKTPSQAIVTVGWTAPSATGVRIDLDGQTLAKGIQAALPYQVPAGGPTGIGATVAFACDGPDAHTIAVTWTADGRPPNTRTVTITRGSGNE